MPLNIDWQQILLHWMNLAILAGGLYFLLYKPVVGFMQKREQHYKDMENKAQAELQKAQEAKAQYEAKLDAAEEEIRDARQKSQAAVQKSAEEQLALAQAQAREKLSKGSSSLWMPTPRPRRPGRRPCGTLSGSSSALPPKPPRSWPSTRTTIPSTAF